MREWLINIRKLKGLTQEHVAKECGLSRTCYAAYEQGVRTPNGKKSKIIGEYLGFSWTLFFEETLRETSRTNKKSA
jgi:transcriptional regulator with XRE-family HTH domain